MSGSGYGYGCWDGSGCGEGCGDGYGHGYGCWGGYGYGYGDGYGYGYGDGYGYGYGYGCGLGAGLGDVKIISLPGIKYDCEWSQKWGVLTIGCESRTLDDWLSNAEAIDEKHGDGIADKTRALAAQLAAESEEA